MAKFMKVIASVLIVMAVTVCAVLLWFDRSQDIDFALYQPDSWVTCDGEFDKNSVEYARLSKWLELNSSNWKSYVATPAHGYFYKSEEIMIYVQKHGVVVNYYDGQNWSQVHKSVDTNGIYDDCKSS